MSVELKTEHPHIVRVEGVRGGRPVIKGTAIEVALVAKLYKMGESPDGILTMYPHLSPAGVYDALSFYHDHQKEIEQLIAGQDIQSILDRHGLEIDEHGRILPRG